MKRKQTAARYRTPPRSVFRELGLGKELDGHIKVIAGFRVKWWSPFGGVVPLIVNAKILRKREGTE